MKTIKFIFLVLNLFFWSNMNAQCFSVTETKSDEHQCIDISITFDGDIQPGQAVIIYDYGVHSYEQCTSDCTFTWCYEENAEILYWTINSGCPQQVGCIVIVDETCNNGICIIN